MKTELQTTNQSMSITDIMTVSKTFFESGMFTDIKSAAAAMVKIMAGAEMGIPAFQSMTGIHIIQGKPTVGAGLMAAKVKGSGKYDYRVIEQSEKKCSIDFYQGKEKIGNSSFTIEQAKTAGTQNLAKHPANMLFARAISNGVKWYTPDVFSGPVYVPEEMEQITVDVQHTVVEPDPTAPTTELPEIIPGSAAWKNAIKYLRSGKATLDQIKASGVLTEENEALLLNAVEEAA